VGEGNHILDRAYDAVFRTSKRAASSRTTRPGVHVRRQRPSRWTHELRRGFNVGRTGEVGWAGLSVHHISPWVDGITLRLGDDVTQFEGGMEFLLDQAADEVSEAARSAWPNSSFPKPHAHVDDGQLGMWFGPEDHPDLALAPIDLRTVLVAVE
jgi:hypothetical protein